MNTNTYKQMLMVEAAGTNLLLHMGSVVEIVSTLPITEIAGVKPWFLGLASNSGKIIPVSDLGGFLFDEPMNPNNQSRLLLIQSNDEQVALRVDDVIGLKKYKLAQFSNTTEIISAQLRPFVNESISTKEDVLPIIVPELIVSSESFLNIIQCEL